jgi:hypothetical protein
MSYLHIFTINCLNVSNEKVLRCQLYTISKHITLVENNTKNILADLLVDWIILIKMYISQNNE